VHRLPHAHRRLEQALRDFLGQHVVDAHGEAQRPARRALLERVQQLAADPKICSANVNTTRPTSVGTSLRPDFCSSFSPRRSSSVRSCALTVGVDSDSSLAARVTLPVRTTDQK
jgi:hypothetical protein